MRAGIRIIESVREMCEKTLLITTNKTSSQSEWKITVCKGICKTTQRLLYLGALIDGSMGRNVKLRTFQETNSDISAWQNLVILKHRVPHSVL